MGDDIDKKIAFAKSKRGKIPSGSLVDALSDRIDSIRKAVDDEEDEDDSGYVDEWEEATAEDPIDALLSPTISEGLSPLVSPGIFKEQVAAANQRAYLEVQKA